MKVKINLKIGNSSIQFEVEAPKAKDALFMAGVLASTPTRCSCGSEDVCLSGNKAKGYTFVKVVCNACNARAQLGEYKEGGYYWKDWEKYIPKEGGSRDDNVPIVEEGEPTPENF